MKKELMLSIIQKRWVMLCLFVVMCIFGYYSWKQLSIEAYPDIADVTSQVVTQVPGLAAEEVEQENGQSSSYVQMNIPYADFYKAAGVDNASEIDAVTSATKNKTRAGNLAAGSYHVNADGTDITGVSCEAGEVDASVFDRYRDPLYKEASFKPYIIAAMIFLAKVKDPVKKLKELEKRATARRDD